MTQLSDDLRRDLLDYLARRPWFEVNRLIVRLSQEGQPSILQPKNEEDSNA